MKEPKQTTRGGEMKVNMKDKKLSMLDQYCEDYIYQLVSTGVNILFLFFFPLFWLWAYRKRLGNWEEEKHE